jgi:hypothetical protein
MAGIAYHVIGNALYRLNRAFDVDDNEVWTTDNLGVVTGSGRVKMADNGTQLCIVVPGGDAYIFTASPDTLTEITDGDFDGPADDVAFIDGYFVFSKTDGKKIFNSLLNDGLSYNALDFTTAEADPDPVAGVIVMNGQLYAIGTETTQKFRNIGRDPAPFINVQGAIWDKGLSAPGSLIKTQGGFVMIGKGSEEASAIWRFNGNNYVKISTIPIDKQLRALSDTELSQITAWSYAEDGAFFVGFNLPDTCIVYEMATKRWHERKSINVNGDDIAYRVQCMTEAYGRIVVGDTQDGRIGELDKNLYKEYEAPIKRRLRIRPYDNLGNNITISELEAVMNSGSSRYGETVTIAGITYDVNEESQIIMSFSDDGGNIFKGGLRRGLGKQGEYNKRQAWRRLGDFNRSRVFEFEFSEPTDPTMLKLEAEAA